MDTEREAVGEWWPLKLKLLEANYEKSKLKIRESSLYCRLSIIEVQSIVDGEKLITEKYEKKAVAERLVVAKEEVAKHAKEKEIISKKAEDDLKRTEEEWKWKMTELTKTIVSLEEEKQNETKSKKVLVDEISTELGILKEKENEWRIENARLISKIQIMEKEHEKFSEIRRIQKVDKEVQAETSEVGQVYRRNGEGNMTETINKSQTIITNIIPPKSPQSYQFEEKDQIMKNTESPLSLPDARNEIDGGKIDDNNRDEKGSSDGEKGYNMDAGGSASRRRSSCQLNQRVDIEIPSVKDTGDVLRKCRKRSAAEAVECMPRRSRSASPQNIRSRITGERSWKVRCDSKTNRFRRSLSVAKKTKKKRRRVTFSGELVQVREFDKDKEWEDTCQKDKQESGERYYYLRKPYDRQRLEIDNSSVARDVLSVGKRSSTPQKDLLNDPSEVDDLKESDGVEVKKKIQKLHGETRNGSVAQINLLNHPNEGDGDKGSSEVKVSRGKEIQKKVSEVANVKSKKERVSEGSGSSNVSYESQVVKNQRKREVNKNVSKDSSEGGESVEGTKVSGESGTEEKSSEDCEVQTSEVIRCPEEKVDNKHGRDDVMRKTPKCKAKRKTGRSGARQACRKTPRRAAKEKVFLDNVGSIKKEEHVETEDVQEIKKRRETLDSGQSEGMVVDQNEYCSKHESPFHVDVEIDEMGEKEATVNRSGTGGMEGIEEEVEHGDVQVNEVAQIKETRRTKGEHSVVVRKEMVYERESKDFNEGGILNGKKTPKKGWKEGVKKQGKTKEAKGIQTDEDTLKEALQVEMDDQLPVVLNCLSTSNGESFGDKANDGDQHEMKKRETRQRGSNRRMGALNEERREVDDTKETPEGKDGTTKEIPARNVVSLNETRGKENKEKAATRSRKAKRKIPVIDDRSEEAAEISKENKERKAEESPTRKVVSLNEITEKENNVKKSRKTKEKISAIDDISEEIAKIAKENYDGKSEESPTRKFVSLNEIREEENKEKAATSSRKAKRKIPIIDDRSEESATISKEKSAGMIEEKLTGRVVSLNENREEENKEKEATRSRKAKRKIPVIDDRSEEAATIKIEEKLTGKVVSLNETREEENKEKEATSSRKAKRKIPIIDDRSEEAATISKEKSAGKIEESLTRKVVSLNENREEENKEKAATRSRKAKRKIPVIDDRSEEAATISKEKSAGKTEEKLTGKDVSLNETKEQDNKVKKSKKAKGKIPAMDDISEEVAEIAKEKKDGKTKESPTIKYVSLNEIREEENKEKTLRQSRKAKGKILAMDDRNEEAAEIPKEKSDGKTEESPTIKVVSLNETREKENEEKASRKSRKAKRKIPIIDDRSEEAAEIPGEKNDGKTEECPTGKIVSLNETREKQNKEKAATKSRKAKGKTVIVEAEQIPQKENDGKTEECPTSKVVSLNETREKENKEKAATKSRKAKGKIVIVEAEQIPQKENDGKTEECPTSKVVSLNETREKENKEKAATKSRKAKGKTLVIVEAERIPQKENDGKTEECPTSKVVSLNETREKENKEKAATKSRKAKGKTVIVEAERIPQKENDGKTEECPTSKVVSLNETREKENKEKAATKSRKAKGKTVIVEAERIPQKENDGKTEECPTSKVVSLNETREKENKEKAATKSRKAKGKTLVIVEAEQIPQKENDGKTEESREKCCRNKESSLNDEKREKVSEVSEKKKNKTRHRTVKGGIVGSRKGTNVDNEEVRRLKDTRGDEQTVVTLSREPLRNETSLSCEPERDDKEKDGEIEGIDEDKENLDVGERKRSQSTNKGVSLTDETRYDDNGENERREVASQRGEIKDMTEQNQETENKVEEQEMKDSMETPEKRKKKQSSFVVNDKSLSNEAMFEHKTQAGDKEEEVVVTRAKRNVSGIINEVTKNKTTSLEKTASNLERRTVGSSNATIGQQTGNTALDLQTTMNASKPAAKKRRRTLYSAKENSRMMNTTGSFFQETLSRNNTRTSGGMPSSLSSFMQAFIIPKLRK